MASGLITEYLGQGLAAARPATPSIPSGCIAFYWATDTDTLSYYSEGAWTAFGGFTAASTTEALTGTNTTKGVTPDALAALWEQGSDVASAGTVSLGEGGYFNITGTTTITDIDFGTDKAGRKAWVKFAGALTLTHNASTLILPTGANITTAAGDTAEFISEGSDVVRCVSYQRASGAALSSSGALWWFTPPTASELSGDLTGDATSSTVTDDSNAGAIISFNGAPVTGDKVRAKVETITSPSSDWTYNFRMAATQPTNNFTTGGLWIYNVANAKGIMFGFGNDLTLSAARRTLTAFSANVTLTTTSITTFTFPFLRVTFTASSGTLTFYASADGKKWRKLGTELVSSYLTANPDRIGFGMASNYAGSASDDFSVSVAQRVKSW